LFVSQRLLLLQSDELARGKYVAHFRGDGTSGEGCTVRREFGSQSSLGQQGEMFEAQPCRAGSAPRAVVADISPKALDVHGPVLLVNREELEQVSEHVVVRELLARVSAFFG
jgi:hypothetical protein